jgi:hypothetical protein
MDLVKLCFPLSKNVSSITVEDLVVTLQAVEIRFSTDVLPVAELEII